MPPRARDDDATAAGSRERPRIAVVVASHDRPLRLRWLLNGLEEQTVAPELWEVVVADDSSGPEARELLESHPLARDGRLRHLALPPSVGAIGRLRNAAWRLAHAPLIAFTDDDCRPPPEWLERALAAAERHPGAIVQGTTLPDPDEGNLLLAPHRHTQRIEAPSPFAQACNIVYPRSLLEAVGGFREEPLRTGEDMDLALRAQAAGAAYVGAPEVLTYHAVEPMSLLRRVRATWRWQDLVLLVKRHPSSRRHYPLGLFWKRNHAYVALAAAGLLLRSRHPLFALLALPWLWKAQPHYGATPRGRARALVELPGAMAVDLAEVATMAAGSVRHRTLFL